MSKNSTKKQKGLGVKRLGVILLPCIMALLFMGCGTKTINLNDYLEIDSSGYDGYGIVVAAVDWEKLEEDYPKLSFTKEAKKELGELIEDETAAEYLSEFVDIEFDKNFGLKNGDSVEYEWDIDDDYSKLINVKLEYKDGKHKVSKLKEVGSFDAFDGISVYFAGIAPDGTAMVVCDGGLLSANDYVLNIDSGLSNGQTVTVSLKETAPEHYINLYGQIPAENRKDFTVEGLDEYIMDFEKLPSDFLATAKAEAKKVVENYFSTWDSTVQFSDVEYAGFVFDNVKTGSSINTYTVILTSEVSSTQGDFATKKLYMPVGIHDIMKTSEGLKYDSVDNYVSATNKLTDFVSIWGYDNPLKCFKALVTDAKDPSALTYGDGFEKYDDVTKIAKVEDLPEEYITKLRENAKEIITPKIERIKEWGTILESEAELVGEYFLVNKNETADIDDVNKLVVVYKTVFSKKKAAFNPFGATDVYFLVEYDGIVKLNSGEYIISQTVDEFSPKSFASFAFENYSGFTDTDDLYAQIITANKDNFTYEMSEGLKQFGE